MALLDWHSHYKNGLLPVIGGLLDQSAYFVAAMSEVDHWISANAAESARQKRA